MFSDELFTGLQLMERVGQVRDYDPGTDIFSAQLFFSNGLRLLLDFRIRTEGRMSLLCPRDGSFLFMAKRESARAGKFHEELHCPTCYFGGSARATSLPGTVGLAYASSLFSEAYPLLLKVLTPTSPNLLASAVSAQAIAANLIVLDERWMSAWRRGLVAKG